MYQETVQVLWNKQVGSSYFRMGLSCNRGYEAAIPGQFVMLRFVDQISPLLRRPFSVHRLVSENNVSIGIELLYKVVGAGTHQLSSCRIGDRLDVLGPLGRGFTISETYQRIFIAAGGIGVAPMVFLADVLNQRKVDFSQVHLFLGGRSTDDVLCKDAFSGCGASVCTTTDDGSEGDQCLITSPLEIEVERLRPDIIYACGPMDMLKCVIGIAETHSVPCEISIETAMACGIGVCLGCAVERQDSSGKYLHACLDGPVFDASEINLI